MQSNDKLIGLIEQAACSINMLSPADLSDTENLQTILEQINKAIAEITDGPAKLLEQARELTSNADKTLQKILHQEVKDAAKSIKAVSQAVISLQDVIDRITDELSTGDSKSDPDPQTADKEIVISEEDTPLVLDFITEANEHIESSEGGLLELESKPDDQEVLNLIFRAFHTIKGMAGFLNLTEIGSLAHSAENLLDLARKGQLILAGQNIDVVFESIDTLKKMIAGLKESVETGKPLSVQEHLPQLLEKLKASANSQSILDSTDAPSAQKMDEKTDKASAVKEPASAQTEELSFEDQRIAPERRCGSEDTRANPIERRSGKDRRVGTVDEKIKVSTSRLNELVNMAGELVIAQLMVAEEVEATLSADHSLGRKIVHQSKIIRELQELSMSMRMIPIQGVFQKMTRLVRDLSHKSGKNINFVTSGEETELDRSIVDKIADPLVHMVRNSVDHGIESSEERAKTGKPSTGQIELRAFHQAGSIVIEIKDDGKGLDKDRILKKAIDNGIVEAGQQLSDEEIFKLILHAGLSTAQKVTSISGRGVGMDVVKKNIEVLRGKIDISSTPGKGTVFTIRMPLTLAIIDGQLVRVGNIRYIIPIFSIERSFKPSAEQVSTVQSRGEMVMVHGELLSMVRLYKLFDIVPDTEDPAEASLVIVEENGKKCCLLVDELLGQQQIVIKSLGEGLGQVKGVSGGSIMGDGKVSLILDIPGIMELAQN